MAGRNKKLDTGLRIAVAWLNKAKAAGEEVSRLRLDGEQPLRCGSCVKGVRSCVYCFGHGHTLSHDDVRIPCSPCKGTGRTRCPVCRGGQSAVRY